MLEILEQYGLSKREAKVYMAGLNLGSSPGSTIARYIDENRVTVYSILKELVKKGFFSAISRDGITYFSPTPPETLLKKLEQKYTSFKEHLPGLLEIVENSLNRPKLTYYEGIEGLKNLYDETLKFDTPLYAFLSDTDIDLELQHYLNTSFIEKRRKNNIHASVIVSPGEETKDYTNAIGEIDPLTTIKIASQNLIGLQGEILLFGNEYIACALYSKKEMIGFLLKSEQFYQSLYTLFNFVWITLPGVPTSNEQ